MTTGARRQLLLVGCYTPDGGPGIHVVDASDPLDLVPLTAHEGIEHPSYLVADPTRSVVHAVSETTGDGGGEVVTLRLDGSTGALAELGRVPSHGAAPCHLALDAAAQHLYVANYVDGSVAAYRLASDGRVDAVLSTHQHVGSGPHQRQAGPHAHGVLPMPDGSLLVTDLGTDQLVRYRHRDPDGSGPLVVVDTVAMPAGSGPRHAVRHPTRPGVLVVGELDSTLTLLAPDDAGRLVLVTAASTLPSGDDPADSLGAAVVVSDAGDRVYVSNRGPDTIATFALDGDRLERLAVTRSGGRTPRDVALHPGGRHLLAANQDGGGVTVLALDDEGVPGDVVAAHPVDHPVCVTVVEVDA